MIVKVNELQLGDEIVIPSGSNLRMLRVVKKPEVRSIQIGRDWYKSVRCTANIEMKNVIANSYKYKVKTWKHTFEEHNTRISVNMDYKDILLIKRNGKEI